MKKNIKNFIIVFLIITNILTIGIYMYNINIYKNNYTYIGEWRKLEDRCTVNSLLQTYSGENKMNAEYEITESEAVEIAAAIYKAAYSEEHLKNKYAEVTYYHDTDKNGNIREYYIVSWITGKMPKEVKKVGLLYSAIVVVINKQNGEILAIRPEEG